VASIGAGSRWTDALQVVEKYGLAVTGGRVGTVGVGGLTVGGGASFYSGYRGFSCDDVINFEVVLTDGSLINANKKENARLWKALNGGSTNFGIVTRFDKAAFPAGPLYGGILKSSWEHRELYTKNFLDMLHGSNPADSQILMWQHETGWSEPTVGSLPVNVDGHSNCSIFAPFETIPTVSKMLGKFTYGQLIASGAAESGKRNVWYSICFHAVREMIDKSEELLMDFIAEINSLSYADSGMDTMFSFQPMPLPWAKVNPGGNVLGVDESLKEDSILFLAQTSVSSRHVEAFFQTRLAAITAELEAYAESLGANTPFRYLNYVHLSQNPLKSYGAKNVAFMKEVAAEYDPIGFVQTRVSGGFKISDVE
ncbi:hypothetical protein ACHAQH_006736, partial [Verticillium albo-atrum]